MMKLTVKLERQIDDAVFDVLVRDTESQSADERARKITDKVIALLAEQPDVEWSA